MTEQALDPRAVTLWRLQGLLRLLVAGLPLSVGAGVAAGILGSAAAGVVAGALAFALQAVLAIAWPPLDYRAFRYALRDQDLLVREGVVFRRWVSIPYTRIQHVDTRQGPVERLLGLSRVLVYTASGMGADLAIPGLAEAQANALRDHLSRRGGDDGV